MGSPKKARTRKRSIKNRGPREDPSPKELARVFGIFSILALISRRLSKEDKRILERALSLRGDAERAARELGLDHLGRLEFLKARLWGAGPLWAELVHRFGKEAPSWLTEMVRRRGWERPKNMRRMLLDELDRLESSKPRRGNSGRSRP